MQRSGGGQGTIFAVQYNSWPGDFIESTSPPNNGYIEAVVGATVPVIYAVADSPGWGINTANLVLYTGHGNSDVISFTYPKAPIDTDPAYSLQLTQSGVNMNAGFFVNLPPITPMTDNGYSASYFASLSNNWGSLCSEGDSLYWLIFDACSVLQYNFNNPGDTSQPNSGGTYAWNVWGNAFNGLHSMLGFANDSFGGFGTAETFADFMLGNAGFSGSVGNFVTPNGPANIVSAWFIASEITQPTGFAELFAGGNFFHPAVPAAMGPIQVTTSGPYGIFSLGIYDGQDFYPGQGPMGPSMPSTNVSGFWYMSTQINTKQY